MNNDIVDYRVLMGDDIEEQVKRHLDNGYEPLGGIAIRHGSSYGATYVQAVIRRKNSKGQIIPRYEWEE